MCINIISNVTNGESMHLKKLTFTKLCKQILDNGNRKEYGKIVLMLKRMTHMFCSLSHAFPSTNYIDTTIVSLK